MSWRRLPEFGSVFGIRFVVFLMRVFGRTLTTGFLGVLAVYYALTSSRTRRVSQEWLGRVGLAATFGNVVRHVHMFARVALDRVYFLQNRTARFELRPHGEEVFLALVAAKQGAILMGSHLGSFEAMGALARTEDTAISMLIDPRSAERFGRVIRELAPHSDVELIAVDPSGFSTALNVKKSIARGRLVGILADRASESGERNVTVDFFGAPASFPAGPWLLAHTLGCPVYLVFGLFRPPRRYDIHCELFADRVVLDRGDRMASVARHAQDYAKALETYARSAPYNWFNFYDFWKPASDASEATRSHKNV